MTGRVQYWADHLGHVPDYVNKIASGWSVRFTNLPDADLVTIYETLCERTAILNDAATEPRGAGRWIWAEMHNRRHAPRAGGSVGVYNFVTVYVYDPEHNRSP